MLAMIRWGTLGAVVTITVIFLTRPDPLALLTFIPASCWWVGLTLVSIPVVFRVGRRWRAVLIGANLLFFAVTVDEWPAVIRSGAAWVSGDSLATESRPAVDERIEEPTAKNSNHSAGFTRVRVASLNCNVGSRAAAGEVFTHEPDIILWQESPGRLALAELTQGAFGDDGSFALGGDCAIAARGDVREFALKTGDKFVRADVHLADGRVIQVVSLRLSPPVIRFDVWNPSSWTDYTERRRTHRSELRRLAELLEDTPLATPLIVGGDFNVPASDGALRELPRRLVDTFRRHGIGWGNTALNDFPAARPDQIWCDGRITVRRSFARATVHSDHRLVICDLEIPDLE